VTQHEQRTATSPHFDRRSKERIGPDQTPRKALAWARVSTGMQEERGLSMPEQLREIHRYAEARGISIVADFQEAASANTVHLTTFS
jgi:hypothetical protein